MTTETPRSNPAWDEISGPEKPTRRIHPNSLANLAPRFTPGTSGNPSGLTKDGRPPTRARLEDAVRDELTRGETMRQIAKRWVRQAKKGDAVAREQLLKRLWPIEQQQGQAKVVVQGVRLEVSPGKTTVQLTQGSSDQGVTEPRDTEVIGPSEPSDTE